MAKFYAVRKGYETGIFKSWPDCQKRIKGFSGAEYKSFATFEDAKAFLINEKPKAAANFGGLCAYVDGSYNIKTGQFGSGIVLIHNGQLLLAHSESGEDPSLASMRNVAGEIKGSEWAINYAIANGYKEIQLYFDYEGIEKWAQGTWKANKAGTIAYQQFYNSIKDKITVYFVKVKAHSGDTYNDLADELAKKACGVS